MVDDSACPSVSVVVPALDEEAHIGACLDSLVAQDYPGIRQILVVDGGSRDATTAVAGRYGDPVSVLPNPRRTAAAAMNIGVGAASGDIVCRADAHTTYAQDYVRRCVEVLTETGADNVGGPMRPVGSTPFGRAVAAATSSPLGVGPGRFHYATERQQVDTVYLGCWRRQTLLRLGGFDEQGLQWAAEDHELNLRLRRGGGTIMLDPTIRSWYETRATPRALFRQYRNYGVGKVSTFAKHGTLPSWRPLAPLALLVGTLTALLVGRTLPRRLAVPVLHAAVCAAGARRIAPRHDADPFRTFAAVEICHWAYALGLADGLGRLLTGRRFESRPERRV